VSTLLGAIKGMTDALSHIRESNGTGANPDIFADFSQTHSLVGMDHVYALERRFLSSDQLARKYDNHVSERAAP
jgi:hypothetical protein